MGTTAEKLQAIVDSKADIGAAITEKGGTVPEKLSEYGNAIRALPSGSEELQLAPLDAKKVYATLRDPAWPPMPQDIADHTIVFLYTGEGQAAFSVTCEGQYTVEIKRCTQSDTGWDYEVESTEAFDSTAYCEKVFMASETPEYRLVTVSASSITNFQSRDASNTTGIVAHMPGCVEIICHLTGMGLPQMRSMIDLMYYTQIGNILQSSRTASGRFSNCVSLVCVMAPDVSITGSISSIFYKCRNLIAVDISMRRTSASVTAYEAFRDCEKLMVPPDALTNYITSNSQNIFEGCLCIKQVNIDNPTTTPIPFANAFKNCISLETVKLKGSFKITMLANNAFKGCISLRRLIFDLPNWTGGSFSIAGCSFDRRGLVEMFKSLPTASGEWIITITGNPGITELTDADRAIATSKGWKLVE